LLAGQQRKYDYQPRAHGVPALRYVSAVFLARRCTGEVGKYRTNRSLKELSRSPAPFCAHRQRTRSRGPTRPPPSAGIHRLVLLRYS
jgi:hypothetical protein